MFPKNSKILSEAYLGRTWPKFDFFVIKSRVRSFVGCENHRKLVDISFERSCVSIFPKIVKLLSEADPGRIWPKSDFCDEISCANFWRLWTFHEVGWRQFRKVMTCSHIPKNSKKIIWGLFRPNMAEIIFYCDQMFCTKFWGLQKLQKVGWRQFLEVMCSRIPQKLVNNLSEADFGWIWPKSAFFAIKSILRTFED